MTWRTIARNPPAQADLAFLSACDSARGGRRLADEAVTLTTAAQLAGYRHAVGSLWSVPDRVAARLTTGFYERMWPADRTELAPGRTVPVTAPDRVATALHEAVAVLRRRFESDPVAWAAFVHHGP